MNICIYLYHINSTSPFPSVPTPANLSGSAVLHYCIFVLLKSLSRVCTAKVGSLPAHASAMGEVLRARQS